MNQIDTVTDEGNQLIQVILDDGTTVQLALTYRAAIQRWMVDVSRGSFEADGINISVIPNFMREWRDVIPFGLACLSTDGGDPVFVEDFVNGRCSLWVLNQADVLAAEQFIEAS